MLFFKTLGRMVKDVFDWVDRVLSSPARWYKNARDRVMIANNITPLPDEWKGLRVGDFVVLRSSPAGQISSVREVQEVSPTSVRLSSIFDSDSHSSKNWWKKSQFFKTFVKYDLSSIFGDDANRVKTELALSSSHLPKASDEITSPLSSGVPQILRDVLNVPKPQRVIEATPPRPEGWGKKPTPKTYSERVEIIQRREKAEKLRMLELTEKYYAEKTEGREKRLREIEELKKELTETPEVPNAEKMVNNIVSRRTESKTGQIPSIVDEDEKRVSE